MRKAPQLNNMKLSEWNAPTGNALQDDTTYFAALSTAALEANSSELINQQLQAACLVTSHTSPMLVLCQERGPSRGWNPSDMGLT
jgi:hypothetical protein